MVEHFHAGLVPTVRGLKQLAERLGCTFERDEVERCYRVHNDGLDAPCARFGTTELWGDDKAAARVQIGNWILRQSAAIHGGRKEESHG